MRYATRLRRAGMLTAIGIALSAGRSLLADDDRAAAEPAAKEAAPAKEPTLPKKAAKPNEAKQAKKGRVLIPKYRLGMAFAPVPAALNEKLALNGEGLYVERVGPGGPAHKAGVKRGDILLAVGGKPIKQYGDAIEGLNASSGKEIPLKLSRDGKTITVAVTPTTHKGDEKVFVPESPRASKP